MITAPPRAIALFGTDEPVAGAMISASGRQSISRGWGHTDADGRFTLEGLEPGTHRVEVQQAERNLRYEETVDLQSDQQIVLRIPTSRVMGQVVDSTDRRPVAGATVELMVADDDPTRRRIFATHRALTDSEGRFGLHAMMPGEYRFYFMLAGGEKYSTEDFQVALEPDSIEKPVFRAHR